MQQTLFKQVQKPVRTQRPGVREYFSVELCAGAGGQALGLEMAGFNHLALIDNDQHSCQTLRLNRPEWNVIEGSIADLEGRQFEGVDLLAGGLPCPPFSVAGKQLGDKDERNLFPEGLRLVREMKPRAVMFENVRGILSPAFADYRKFIQGELEELGYASDWRLLNASEFGVSQLRPRVVLVALPKQAWSRFEWPQPSQTPPQSVGELLYDLIASEGWEGADQWKLKANAIAPTIVGGSKKHGGPDLGPTRARKAWAALGVNGQTIADEVPKKNHEGEPKLTVRMVARVQGFPDAWHFFGKKTAAYRQVGNAFPPPVASAVAKQIMKVLKELDYGN